MTGQPRPRRAPVPQIWSTNLADYPFTFVALGNGAAIVRCRPGLTEPQKRAIATAMRREADALAKEEPADEPGD